MDFWDLTTLLFRRWYAALPLLAATVVAVFATMQNVSPNYIANAYVQLIPPTEAPKVDQTAQRTNPWIDLGLATLANASMVSVKDESVLDALTAAGFSENFTMTLNGANPLVTIEVTGTSEQQASQTADQLVKRFVQSTVDLQAAYGVQQANLITTRRLDLGNNLTQSDSNVKRAVVAVGVAGVLLSVGFTIGLDAVVRRRLRRQASQADNGPPDLRRRPRESRVDAPVGSQQQLVIAPVSPSVSQLWTGGSAESALGQPGGVSTASRPADGHLDPMDRGLGLPVPTDATVVLPLTHQKSRIGAEAEGNQRR